MKIKSQQKQTKKERKFSGRRLGTLLATFFIFVSSSLIPLLPSFNKIAFAEDIDIQQASVLLGLKECLRIVNIFGLRGIESGTLSVGYVSNDFWGSSIRSSVGPSAELLIEGTNNDDWVMCSQNIVASYSILTPGSDPIDQFLKKYYTDDNNDAKWDPKEDAFNSLNADIDSKVAELKQKITLRDEYNSIALNVTDCAERLTSSNGSVPVHDVKINVYNTDTETEEVEYYKYSREDGGSARQTVGYYFDDPVNGGDGVYNCLAVMNKYQEYANAISEENKKIIEDEKSGQYSNCYVIGSSTGQVRKEICLSGTTQPLKDTCLIRTEVSRISGRSATYQDYREIQCGTEGTEAWIDPATIPDTIELANPGTTANLTDTDPCLANGDGFTAWVICPILNSLDGLLSGVYGQTQDAAKFDLSEYKDKGVYQAWGNIRVISNLLLITLLIIYLIMAAIKG
jgi:hypothetical protein